MGRAADGTGGVPRWREDLGRWEARPRYIDPATGQAKRPSIYGATKRECAGKVRDLLDDVAAGVAPTARGAGYTVADAAQEYVTTVLPLSGSAPRTIAKRSQEVRLYVVPLIGQVRVDRLRASQVRGFLVSLRGQVAADGLPLSVSVQRSALVALRQVLDAAVADKLIRDNPARSVPMPALVRKRPEPVPLTAELVPAVLSHVPARNRALVLVYLLTGVRRDELLDLEWDDVDGDQLRIRRAKGRPDGRIVPLSAHVAAVLREHRAAQLVERMAARSWADPELVFPNYRGQRRTGTGVGKMITAATRAAGAVGSTHVLRHTAATWLHTAGVAPADAAAMLGQATETYLRTYVHATTAGQRHAADQLGAVVVGASG